MLLIPGAARLVPDAPAPKEPRCLHCGLPLGSAQRERGFCCAGCAYVFRLVHEHGLDRYYRIKDELTAPVDPSVFQPIDIGWLREAQKEAESSGVAIPELLLGIQGISCAACVWLVERVFRQMPGSREILVNAPRGTMLLRWERGAIFDAAEFGRKLHALGYAAGPAGEHAAEPESRGLVKRIGLCAAFAMNAMLFSFPVYFGMEADFEWAGLFALLSLACGTLGLLVGGAYFVRRAVNALRAGALHIDLPIAIGIVGAYSGSVFGWAAGREEYVYFDFVTAFILLMLVGRWAQVAAVERNRRRLLDSRPVPAKLNRAGGGQVAPADVRTDDRLVLGCGQVLPVDARLETGSAQLSLSSITGEPEPRLYRAGQRVPAGARNVGRAAIEIVALQPWAESLLSRLLASADRAVAPNPLLDRIVRGYVAAILGISLLAGAAWWLATASALRAGSVVTAILVVSCPCAIALAFPLADEIATVRARRRGVYVREGDLWPRLHRVREIVFDKTGTLTLEVPVLRNPDSLAALEPEARSALLALVADNPHPVSQCLVAALLASGPLMPLPGPIAESIGLGADLLSDHAWSLGRPGWRDTESGSGTNFCRDGAVLARFHFIDTARPDTAAEIAALRARGLEVRVLSGDRDEKVKLLGLQLGLPAGACSGDLLPEAKAERLGRAGTSRAMMLGDGANDSLAFDRAFCRGTPVVHRGVLEPKADFYYLGAGIGGIRALFEIDRDRRRTQQAILIFSIAYNALAVGLAVAGRMNPLLAAALMPVNSLLTLAIVTLGMRPRA